MHSFLVSDEVVALSLEFLADSTRTHAPDFGDYALNRAIEQQLPLFLDPTFSL